MAAAIAERLPFQIHDLSMAGVSAPRAMTAQEIAEYVRTAFNPDDASFIDACRTNGEPTGITWANAGPTAAEVGWKWYRHDDYASIVYEMAAAPRGAVESKVLEPLLQAHDGIDRKRVTMLYRPHDPASAPVIADRDRRAAFGRATARGRGEQNAEAEVHLLAARQAAREQASGAGLTRFALLATATARPDDLKDAGSAIGRLGRSAHLQLRPCRGVFDSAFTAGLGVGLVLNAHTKLPAALKEWL